MNKVDIYIDGTRIDLFQDEDIKIKLQALKTEDISKSFGDFTQQFTIPASPLNNKVLKHFSSVNFADQHANLELIDAEIRINGVLFRQGSVSVDGSTLKEGYIQSYQLTFYAELTKFVDDISDKTLRDLTDLQNYTFSLSPDEVFYSIQTGSGVATPLNTELTDGVSFPLIFSDKYITSNNLVYDFDGNVIPNASASYTLSSGDYSASPFWREFKPAIQFSKIIDAIESQFDITLGGIASDDSHPLRSSLSMWCNAFNDNSEGYDNFYYPLEVDSSVSGSSLDEGRITADGELTIDGLNKGFRIDYVVNETCDINMIINGNYVGNMPVNSVGSGTAIFIRSTVPVANRPSGSFVYTVSSGDVVEFRMKPRTIKQAVGLDLNVADFIVGYIDSYTSPSVYSYAQYNIRTNSVDSSSTKIVEEFNTFTIADVIPDMKVKDFLNGVCILYKANLIPAGIDPINGNLRYNIVENADTYYGGNFDITEYVDNSEVSIAPPVTYNQVSLSFKDNNSLSNTRHDAAFGKPYGSDVKRKTSGAETLEVKCPFSLLKFRRGGYEGSYDSSEVGNMPSIANDIASLDGGSLKTKPVIFYKSSSAFKIADGTIGGQEDLRVTVKMLNGQVKYIANVANTTNHFGGVALGFDGVFEQQTDSYISSSHYSEYWEAYVNSLFDDRTRKYTLNAVLPYNIAVKLKANSLITIQGTVYTIDSATVSLKDGKTNLVLINNGYLYS